MKKYLIFDYGASHGRCIVGLFDGKKIDMEVINNFDNRPVKYAGSLYWDILRLSSEIKIGMQMAFKAHPDIQSIAIDTWGCDFGFIDADGKLVGNPTNYRDSLRYQYKEKLEAEYGELELYMDAGSNLNNIMGLYHLYALMKIQAEELKVADRLLMIPDLLNYYLTGIAANEYTDANMFLATDPKTRQWSKKLINKLGFEEKWFRCEMRMPGTILGDMKPDIVKEFGVPNIPVINVASHDSSSAMAGVPVSKEDKNWLYLSLGTWAIIGIESDKFYNTPESFPSGFATQGGCENKNNFVNLITGLWVIQQCAEKWKTDFGSEFSWNAIVDEVRNTKQGIAFIDPNDSAFALPDPDMPGVIQQYCRKTGQSVPNGVGEVASCVYEGLTMALLEAFENLKKFTGKNYSTLYVVGGGSKNVLLCQWLADALSVKVKAGPAETTSLGNLLMQMRAMGDIMSLEEGREIAADSFNPKVYLPTDQTVAWAERFQKYKAIRG